MLLCSTSSVAKQRPQARFQAIRDAAKHAKPGRTRGVRSNWHCPVCQYVEEIASVEEVGGALAVDEADI